MDELVLGVILLGAALPVAISLVYGFRLLLALVFIQILAQVQDPPTVVLPTNSRNVWGFFQSIKLEFKTPPLLPQKSRSV